MSAQHHSTSRKQRLTATRIQRILIGEGKVATECTVRKRSRRCA